VIYVPTFKTTFNIDSRIRLLCCGCYSQFTPYDDIPSYPVILFVYSLDYADSVVICCLTTFLDFDCYPLFQFVVLRCHYNLHTRDLFLRDTMTHLVVFCYLCIIYSFHLHFVIVILLLIPHLLHCSRCFTLFGCCL